MSKRWRNIGSSWQQLSFYFHCDFFWYNKNKRSYSAFMYQGNLHKSRSKFFAMELWVSQPCPQVEQPAWQNAPQQRLTEKPYMKLLLVLKEWCWFSKLWNFWQGGLPTPGSSTLKGWVVTGTKYMSKKIFLGLLLGSFLETFPLAAWF